MEWNVLFYWKKKILLIIFCRIDNFVCLILDRYRCKDRFFIYCIKY